MTSDLRPASVLFFDANVLISAAWKESREISLLGQMEGVTLITSDYVMGEVLRNLHQISQVERLRGMMRSVRVVSFKHLPDIPEGVVLPAKDRPVLAAAIESRASHLVSGDKKYFGPLYGKMVNGLRITAPTELLAVLRRRLP